MSGSKGGGGGDGSGKGRGRGRRRAAVLTVAGADPSGASGVYRDVATFEALGCTGVAAITALTAQNTSRFASAEPASARMISAQIGAVFEDFDVGAVKVGMVRGGGAVRAVSSALRRWIGKRGKGRKNIPVVVDPVVRSTTGGRLLDARSLGPYREHIVPLAAVVTPNVYELGVLAGSGRLARAGESGAGAESAWAAVEGDAREAAQKVICMGAGSVIVTGVYGKGGRTVMDMVFEGAGREPYPAVAGGRGGRGGMRAAAGRGRMRGSGCTHSAALAALLASGAGLAEAARGAAAIAHRSVTGALPRGTGLPVAAPAAAADAAVAAGGPTSRSVLASASAAAAARPGASASEAAAAGRLEAAAASLAAIPGIGRHIPECQTNIAYAPPGRAPASPDDVIGLDGRIVSTMSGGAIVPGRAARGASRHVASALVEASRRFPSLRAAANIRYDPRTVDAARSLGMAVSSYDRADEPAATRRSEGSSVRWGVRSALRGARRRGDAVYHTGDLGKEPMIVVFGTGPRDVVSKVARIAAAAAEEEGRRGRRGRPTEIK